MPEARSMQPVHVATSQRQGRATATRPPLPPLPPPVSLLQRLPAAMWEGASPWLFAALYYPALQVLPLYLFARGPRSETIYRRMAATAAALALGGWLPTAQRLAARVVDGKAPASLAPSLGLRVPGLAAAAALPLLLTMLLFAGPLLALALSRPRSAGSGVGARFSGQSSSLWAQRVTHLPFAVCLRNWVAAPLLEEFLFRACLLSYLLAAGASPARCIALSPALFAACHLHHLHDLIRFQGVPPAAALQQVASQFVYTWVFGSLASFYFIRSRHLVAAVLPHAFCNLVGPPALPQRHRRAVAVAMVAGAAAFFCLLRPLTEPHLFANLHGWVD
ncbi:hypothetical protein ABPG75_009090 [Micractinium tetrahymenae]